jgi:hypothetical protein
VPTSQAHERDGRQKMSSSLPWDGRVPCPHVSYDIFMAMPWQGAGTSVLVTMYATQPYRRPCYWQTQRIQRRDGYLFIYIVGTASISLDGEVDCC